jgi:transaldolase
MVDHQLEEIMENGGDPSLAGLRGQAALTSARLAYHAFRETFTTPRFEDLQKNGVRRQRPLWASTGTKNPAYSDVMYVLPLIGPDTVNTMPTATIAAFLKQTEVKTGLEADVSSSREVMAQLAQAGIDLKEITDQLLTQGVMAFAEAFDKLMLGIEAKRTRLLADKGNSGG